MKKIETKDDITVLARKALDCLWEKALLRGRPSGRKLDGNNCFKGTNITMALDENELISVCRIDGKLKIHSFVRAKETSLGKKVKQLLLKAGLPVE
jgi:hypothetical protein